MPRKGDVRARLQEAALDLYGERGFEKTTTAQIAERASVTERTYFRHFADKREVLFDGEAKLDAALTRAMVDVPSELGPLSALRRAFLAVEGLLAENRSVAGPRHAVIERTPALRERELAKVAALTHKLAALLQGRGVAAQPAMLAAQVGMAAFTQAAVRWLEASEQPFAAELEEAFDALRRLAAS